MHIYAPLLMPLCLSAAGPCTAISGSLTASEVLSASSGLLRFGDALCRLCLMSCVSVGHCCERWPLRI